MPYIPQELRDKLLSDSAPATPSTPGELNFILSHTLAVFWERSEQNYQTINDIIGALEGAKLEFYRRVAVGYEDQKREDNGDVYG